MATPEKNTLPAAPEPEGETRKERSRYHHRGQIRLAISIPALMVLFCLAYGIASLQLFDSQWAAMERAGADEVAVKLLRGHLYTMLILSLLAFITGLGLAFAILRPIAALRRAARQVVASGEFTLRAPQLASVPELGDLSRSFNSMIEFVNESIQERNRYLIDGIVTGLLTLDRHGRVTALNSTGAKILGLRSEALLGHSISDLRDSFPSKYHPLWDYLEDSLWPCQRSRIRGGSLRVSFSISGTRRKSEPFMPNSAKPINSPRWEHSPWAWRMSFEILSVRSRESFSS
ncbi:HAMP domain-containing protein [Candidatus Sumerlaeota bacterium]|nr:HAMP domain-containing protein [Candidatus Sumerlaeota bacterium]